MKKWREKIEENLKKRRDKSLLEVLKITRLNHFETSFIFVVLICK